MSEQRPRSYREMLGVAPGAGLEEIKRAYRREAKRCHSDLTRGSDDCMRALNEAYEALMHSRPRGRFQPPPPSEPGPPGPYLTPSAVAWTASEGASPVPVRVRLSNRGGAVSTIEPERTGGAFWTIEESIGVMSGDDLADVVIAPTGVESMPAGTHVDELTFLFDGRPARLTIAVAVAPRPQPDPPPPAAAVPPREPPPSPPLHRHRDRLMGVASVLTCVLFLAVLGAVLFKVANDPPGADATPSAATGPAEAGPRVEGISDIDGHGVIRQGGQPQWEVLGVDVTGSRESFSVDFGGSQPAGLESSCVYVRGTKVFPSAISDSRYLQASPGFSSQSGAGALGPGREHRHSYTLTFPYHGAGSYQFVYGCSSDFLPGIDLFERQATSRSPAAAVVRGPLYADGVLVVARNVRAKGDTVKLGPIDLFDGGLMVQYARTGSKGKTDVRGRSCLRRRGRVIASPAGPNEHSLLLATPDNQDIPAASGPYELQFLCGGYEPALPVSGRLFGGQPAS